MAFRRIFVGPVEVAGYYGNLASGLRSAGATVRYFTFNRHRFYYDSEAQVSLLARIFHFLTDPGRAPKCVLGRRVFWASRQVLRLYVFLYYASTCDVFIFAYGESLLPGKLDVPLLKLLGKRVIVNMAHGSELRPPFMDGALQPQCDDKQALALSISELSASKVKRLRFYEKHAYAIIGAPFSSTQYALRPLINTFSVGLPFAPSEAGGGELGAQEGPANLGAETSERPIRILHSPSNHVAKGTALVREAVASLQADGHLIAYVEVAGRPHGEVLSEIQRCDFVVDQVYSDAPMGAFAAEAGYFGKPALVAGYRLEHLRRFVPGSRFPPSVTCHPDDLLKMIERLVVDESLRVRVGNAARDFVRTVWSPAAVASRYLRLAQGSFPDDWCLRPTDVTYVHGWGQTESHTRDCIRAVVARFGKRGLQLSHRPDLEAACLDLAGLIDGKSG